MKNNQLTNREISVFASQIALILNAGISTYEGISIMKEDNEDGQMTEMYQIILEHLDQGESLYTALVATQKFPDFALNMIEIGEQSGELEDVMKSLNTHYQRLHDTNEGLKNAISYPLMMITLMLIVVVVLITQVLPIFNKVFEQLGSSITGFSKAMLDLGNILTRYSYIFIGIFIVIGGIGLYLFKNKKGKEKLHHFIATFPLTKNISMDLSLSKFTSGIAIALSSGLDIDYSFQLSKELIDNPRLQQRVHDAEELMQEKDLADALVDAKVLTGMNARLIKLGNKTGHIDMVMRKISDYYDQETNERIHHLIGIIEPTLVAVLSIIVGLILLSVMLPLMGIMSSL